MSILGETRTIALQDLSPYPDNPRKGDVDALAQSLEVHGQYRPIVVQKATQQILAGNHTWQAARKLGWTEIAATFVDVDDEQAAKIVLVDNRSNDLAEYDDGALADMLAELSDFEGTGYTQEDVDELLQGLERGLEDKLGADTEPIDPPAEPKTRLGDLYEMGDHRLVCGDSTNADAMTALLCESKADIVFTDPPYGMSYGGGRRAEFGEIKGDNLRGGDLIALVQDALGLATAMSKSGAAYYVCFPWRSYTEFEAALIACGLEPSACIVWDKGWVGLGNANYRPQHEFIFYVKGGAWYGDKAQSDVWAQKRAPSGEYAHPTQKPVELIERALGNSSKGGDAVLDMFGGSGSTLIAAENTRRHAYLMELDPAYCDVIVDRWERHTGKKAKVTHAE